MPDDKDKAQVELKKLPLKPGDRFTHYKVGGIYEIVTLAVKEDTLEPLVVYYSHDKHSIWVRTYQNFTEDVDAGRRVVKRFALIGQK